MAFVVNRKLSSRSEAQLDERKVHYSNNFKYTFPPAHKTFQPPKP